jgi:HlyD family secretion protein
MIKTILLVLLVFKPLVHAAPMKPQVVIEKLEKKNLFDLLIYPARIETNTHGVILSEVAGVIDTLDANFGDKVKKGQLLARIRNLDPVYRYRPVEVRSTIDGVLSARNVTRGTHVGIGQELFQVVDPTDFKITIEVASQDLGLLSIDDKGQLTLRGFQERPEVQVIGISPLVNSATGTARVELSLVEGSIPLPIGAIGRVEIQTNSKEGMIVLNDAIFYRGQKAFARVVDAGGVVSIHEVSLGRKRSDKVEILDGLNEGQLLVVRSSGFVRDGSEVIITNPPASVDSVE